MTNIHYKSYFKVIFLIFVFLMGNSYLYAQNSNQRDDDNSSMIRRGVVVDEFGNPVGNATVTIEGASVTATTNEEGYFEIQASGNSTLTINHPDFYVRKMHVGGNNNLMVGQADSVSADVAEGNMDELRSYISQQVDEGYTPIKISESYYRDKNELNTLYGSTPKEEMLGSVSTVYTNQLTTTPATAYSFALPGRLAGLYTEQTSGFRSAPTGGVTTGGFIGSIASTGFSEPSDNNQINLNIRGQTPVTVIDGVQRNIFSLDPENIESVSVLKDPLSTIMLGQRSSRGILLVTTKEPEPGDLRFSFTSQTGFQQPLSVPEPLSAYEYAYYYNEALQNDGSEPVYDAEFFNALRNGESQYRYPSVNWYDQVLKDQSRMSSAKINVSGGGEVAQYNVNLNYTNQQGMFATTDEVPYNSNSKLDRYVINSSVNVDVNPDLNIAMQILGRIENGNQPGAGTGNILNTLQGTPSTAYPVFNPDGSYGGGEQYGSNLYSMVTNSGYIEDESRDVLINMNLEYDMNSILEGLSFKSINNYSTQSSTAITRSGSNYVYDYNINDETNDTTYTRYGGSSPLGNGFTAVSNATFWYSQLSFDYENRFKKHGIGAKVLADRRSVTINYDLPGVLANLGAQTSYDYDKKYFVEAGASYSGYNRYPPGEQYDLFYAFGLGYDLARESFIRDNISWLDQFKLRGTWGKTGSGVDNSGYYIWRQTYSDANFVYPLGEGDNTAVADGRVQDALANPNITWEKADKLNVGVDAALFNRHVRLTADYYHEEYYDLIQQRGADIELIGAGYPAENIGRNLRKGVELSLRYQNNAGNFNYFVGANWTRRQTEVLYMDEQERRYPWSQRTGRPVGTLFGYVADGFFQSEEEIENSAVIEGAEIRPGDVRYKDLNNDGIINQFDIRPIANQDPLSFFGFTTGFSYKGFNLNLLLQGVYNRDIYYTRPSFVGGSQGQGYGWVRNRWTPETAGTADYPRLFPGGNGYNTNPGFISSSYWVEDGSYIRLKNASIEYALPFKWTQALNVSEIRVFVNGLNLYTLAAYDKIDPEVRFQNYPNQRVVNTGFNIKF